MSDRPRYRVNDSSVDVGIVLGSLSASAAPGPVFVTLLTSLGHSESAARNLLTKLVHTGGLSATKSGRVTIYAFTDQNARKYQQVEGTGDGPGWDGAFQAIVYDIPETQRRYRDRFRYFASYNGYGTLRPGVLISARPHSSDLDALMADAPPGARVHAVTLTPPDLGKARELAAEAWDLERLSQRYAEVVDEIRTTREQGPGAIDEDPLPAFRTVARLYRHVFALEQHNPDLPAELLPADWPRAGYWAELATLNGAWGPSLQAQLRRIADAADPAGLTAYYPPPWESGAYPPVTPPAPEAATVGG